MPPPLLHTGKNPRYQKSRKPSPGAVWTFWRKEKSLAPAGIPIPSCPACSLVPIPTTPSRFLIERSTADTWKTALTSLSTTIGHWKMSQSSWVSRQQAYPWKQLKWRATANDKCTPCDEEWDSDLPLKTLRNFFYTLRHPEATVTNTKQCNRKLPPLIVTKIFI